jgi:hypothetical protein
MRPLRRAISRRGLLGGAIACGSLSLVRSLGFCQTSPREVPWLDEVRRPPSTGAELRQEALSPLGSDAETINDLTTWQRRRTELQAWWFDFLGARPQPAPAPGFRVLEREQVGTVVRERIAYDSAPNWPTEAYLLRPAQLSGPVPGVVVFHSTVEHSIRQPAGVEGAPEKAFGLQLAQQGLVTLCPRNFLWPDNHTIAADQQTERHARDEPHRTGMARMLSDAIKAVDVISSLPEVDSKRIGAVGHSLGAKEVLYLAAFDPRVQVTVSSEGGIGIRFSNWDAPWYLGQRVNEPTFAHDHHELLAMVAPRPFLLIGGDSADGDRSWPYIEAALPIYRLFTDLPRLGLLNHRGGHAVPPLAQQRIGQWLTTYL